MTLSIIISVLLFFIGMLIFFSVRASDKKSRSLANVNAQIKNFKNDVSATTQRLISTTQDCADNVQSHIDKARDTVDIVSSCLDRLSQHQKDLTDLESVCVDYRRALEKLKVQTEQAESRVAVVQQEVRKAESVSEFVKSFHEESEMLVNQMQDLKAEYVRLVTSTQEALKQQAALQKTENADMLQEFQSTVERQKSQMAEFIAIEKQGFERECSEQSRIAENVTEKIKESRSELDASIKSAYSSVQELKEDVKTYSDEGRAELESIKAYLSDSIDAMRDGIEEYKKELDVAVKEADEKLNSSFEAILNSFNSKKGQFDELVEEKYLDLDKRMENREKDLKESVAIMNREVEEKVAFLEREKEAYQEKIRLSYREALISEIEEVTSNFEKIKNSVIDQIDELYQRAKETRETISALTSGESEKLSDTIARLKDLDEKILLSEANLTTMQEQVTQAKEELYKTQKEHGKLVGQINEAHKELERAQNDLTEAKEKRMEEAANTVKLRLEMERQKEKNNGGKIKSRAETIIEEFPDDIFIGDEEEIDLSDD